MPGSDHSGQEQPDHLTASQPGRTTPGGEAPEVGEAVKEAGDGGGPSDSVEVGGRFEAREGPVQASQAVPRRQDRRDLERRMRQALRDEVRLQTEAWERKLRRIAVQKAILSSVVAGIDGVGTCGLDFGEGGTLVIRGTGRSTIAALGAEVVKYRGRGPMLEAVVGLPGKRRYWLKFKGPAGERLALVCQLVSVRADKAGGRGRPRA